MQPQQPIVIAVMLMPDGQVNVQGPLNNPVLCYGLLESGKDAVRRFAEGEADKRIIEPPPGLRIVDPQS